ncbi:isopentenyl-diphosphate delta-isomerase [Phytobacter palmae]|uniref:Isopentenyl-diphosphate Delta-isomerase n=1 Tax=Phytobacter palmae TaxID=1855371 RepID=A0ABU9V330_9ENTR|nr:isopentenyl-diphosphate Delta-isomerase [Escherichia coli]SFE17385.1 isopentenyl-diphosphate delta-isomerase [Phytobacter palmae]
MQEHVILLDEHGSPIGMEEKYTAHHHNTPLHLAFSSWLFNSRGECLVTRRAMSKKAWPGVWTNSVCGHPQQGETLEQAMVRRCRYEVGVDIIDITSIAPGFRYRETDPSGIVENEICPVFAAQIITPLRINTDEVMDYHWVKLDALFLSLVATPWAFSPWMVLEADNANEQLREFAASVRQ